MTFDIKKNPPYFKHPARVFLQQGKGRMFRWMDDETYVKLLYKSVMDEPLHLEDPKTFNEKVQWTKLYDRNPIYTQLVDKLKVRSFVADRVGEEYLVPLLGSWKNADQIQFETLPNRFVLKCNHDSQNVIVCRDKSECNTSEIRKRMKKALKKNYFYVGREWAYRDVEPCVLAEEYLEDESGSLNDYKFFCFDGEPRFMYVASGRQTDFRMDFFDMDFDHLPICGNKPWSDDPISKPECFEEMKTVCAALAKGIAQVRIDLYNVNGRPFFGEMTFYNWNGIARFDPPEWDLKFGNCWDLPTGGGVHA